MTTLEINLPSLNGNIEVGIRFGFEPSLIDARKLPMYHPAGRIAPHALVKQNAVLWAYRQFQDLDAKRIFVNGVAGILDLGLIRRVETTEKPDGNWIKTFHHEAYDQAIANEVMKMINSEDTKKGVTLAVATKANFWLTNYHTDRQDQMVDFVKKTLVRFKEKVTDQMVSAVYSLGYFCSTLYVLTMAGILHIRPTTEVTSSNCAVLSISADVKLWFSSMPAGTHRLAVAYEAAKRLLRSVYAPFCPGIEDFKSLPEMKAKVMAKPAFYHINALYLTGVERDYADTDNEQFLGRLGTFINILYKRSTLAKSPHMAISRVENYYDYDPAFKADLVALLQKRVTTHAEITEEIIEAFKVTPQTTINLVRQAFLADVNANLQPGSSGTATPPPTKKIRLSSLPKES